MEKSYIRLFYFVYFSISLIGFWKARNIIMAQNSGLLIKIIIYVALFWMIYSFAVFTFIYPFSGFVNYLRAFFISYFKSLIFMYCLLGYVSFFYLYVYSDGNVTDNQFCIILISLIIPMLIPYFANLFKKIYGLIRKSLRE